MLISIDVVGKYLPEIMGDQYDRLTIDKENGLYKLTIQNLWNFDIYLENWEVATPEAWYKLATGNEVEIMSKNIHKLNLVSYWSINNNIRVITN